VKKEEESGHPISTMPTDRLEVAIKAKRPRKKNHIVFHHDRPHVEGGVVQSINDKEWDLLEHLLYSPTETPTNYHVNRSLKNWQMGKVYNDFDEFVADVKVWIASKNRHFFAHGIDWLSHKWGAAIEADGDYPPKWSFDYVFSLLL
jgi:hypothetical protein